MKKHFLTCIKFLVAIVCLGVIFQKIGFAEVAQHFTEISLPWFLGALTLGLANRFLMAWRWLILLRARSISATYLEIVRIIFISNFVGMLIPVSVGVDAIRLYQIQKAKSDISNTSGSLVADRLISILMLCLLSIAGVTMCRSHIENTHMLNTLLVVSFSLIGIIYIITANWTYSLCAKIGDHLISKLESASTSRQALEPIASSGRKTLSKVTRFHQAIGELTQQPRSILPVAGLTLLVQLSRVAQIHMLFRGLDVSPPWIYEFAFIPMIVLLSLLPISPMGLGIKEGAFVYFFGTLGIAPAALVATSLFTHVIVLLVILPGGYFFLAQRKEIKHAADEGQKE